MWSGFQTNKSITNREIELALNWTEPENQAEPVSGADHDKKLTFFTKSSQPHYLFSTQKGSLIHQHVSKKGVSNFSHSSQDTLYTQYAL